jgi:hypothetical protein
MSILKLQGMIVYCMLDKPTQCYDADKGFEFKCGVVVDEDTADSFAEQFPKQAARKVKRTEFEGIYKVAPPEGSEKNLYVITLKKNAHITDKKSGEKVPLPARYLPRVLQRQGGTLVDITTTEKPANGSTGIVSYEIGETKFGDIARLKNVLIEHLIPYEGGSTYEVGDEFADDGSDTPVKIPPKAVEKAKVATAAKAKAKPVEDEFDSSDLPF